MPQRIRLDWLEFDAYLVETNPIRNSDFTFVLGHRRTCVIFPNIRQLGFVNGGTRDDVYRALRNLGARTIDSVTAVRVISGLITPSYGTVRVWTDDSQEFFGFRVRVSKGNRMVCHHDRGLRSDMLAPTTRIAAAYSGGIASH